jgi:hypothetical protein
MKKISIPLTPDQIIALDNFMSQIEEKYRPDTMEGKAIKSISYSVADKFRTKSLNLQRNINLYTPKKQPSQILTYHEAFALFSLLNTLLPVTPDFYLQKTQNYLHQKLQ